MDIAALSMGLSQMKLQNEVSTSVMKMAIDNHGGAIEKLMTSSLESLASTQKIMEQSVKPHLGGNFDVKL